MATVAPTITRLGDNVVILDYLLTNADSDGAPFKAKHFGDYSDRNVAVYGTFGGATITVQGSGDSASWTGLTDAGSVAISLGAAGTETINETTPFTRPLLTGGAGSSVHVVFTIRRGRGGLGV